MATYKIKLASGRVLGPLDLERVRLLIAKNQITGQELAREHPVGEWKDINQFGPLADLLIARISQETGQAPIGGPTDNSQKTGVAQTQILPGATALLTGDAEFEELPEEGASPKMPERASKQEQAKGSVELEDDEEGEKTVVAVDGLEGEPSPGDDDEKTRVAGMDLELEPSSALELQPASQVIEMAEPKNSPDRISSEATVVFQRSSQPASVPLPTGKRKFTPKDWIKVSIGAIVMGVIGFDLFLSEPDKPLDQWEAYRPTMPAITADGKVDADKSQKLYAAALPFYILDNVPGYKKAAELFRQSASADINNVKALGMLASSYLNLIDSSNKDENYFTVLAKLIEMSRAKGVDVPETVIADVEYFVIANKAETAQNRVVEYTKTHPNYGAEMFYYLAFSYYNRGDAKTAAIYLSRLPNDQAFSPKVFYLKGLVADKLDDKEGALAELERAVAMKPEHAKSRLKIAEILHQQNRLKEAVRHLDYITKNNQLLPPLDLARAYYLQSLLSQLYERWDNALAYAERASRLDKNNHDYILEKYTLRAKAGDSTKSIRSTARMYYFLGEGEKLVKQAKYQDALTQFLQARQANDQSPLPPIKIGDMFYNLRDLANAKMNYKIAADRAPNNIDVWSKYIDVLIQSYEWEEAQKAMDKFRKMSVSQSAIDKAAADMYQKQGRAAEAQVYYRKAMSRDVIDPDVYIAYARSLMSVKNFKDAPLFFALALRKDPLNVDAIVGTAKCIAETESIDRAITMLQDELQKGTGSKADLLGAIAEFQIQKGDWDQAQQNVNQAMAVSPEYAFAWKLQGQIYLNKENTEKTALDKALDAFKSYSDRNPSDPSGYLERFRLFGKKGQYDQASSELDKVYAIYPKYPNLHYYKGLLYGFMQNHKEAVREFKIELQNNQNSTTAMLSLGKSLIDLGAYNDALTYLTKCMQLAPQWAEPKNQAGYANFLLKNYQGAIALYLQALSFDKGNPEIYKRLGVVYREVGDQRNAAEMFRTYLKMEPDAKDRAMFEKYL